MASVGRPGLVRHCSPSPEDLGHEEKGEGPLRETIVVQVWNGLVWVVFGVSCYLYGLSLGFVEVGVFFLERCFVVVVFG